MREGRNGGKLKSGNTTNVGRKKELPELSIIIANSLGDEKDGVTDAEAILNAMKAKAKKGDVKAAEFVFGYGYGKPRQTTDTNITSTEPLVIIRTEPKSE
jgi:hypothetical protein